jgi:hypothetical protein
MPRLEVDYNKTVMYKIVCNDLNIKDIYVGHTTDFIRRKRQHKSNCNVGSCKYKIYKTIQENGGWENWIMLELEKYPCRDGNEARTRERDWYENLNSKLNIQYPARTKEEYFKDNKEKIQEYKKEYRKINKEKLQDNRKEYYAENKEKILEHVKEYKKDNKEKIKESKSIKCICECGCEIRKCEKARHIRSIKHNNLLEKLKINI